MDEFLSMVRVDTVGQIASFFQFFFHVCRLKRLSGEFESNFHATMPFPVVKPCHAVVAQA